MSPKKNGFFFFMLEIQKRERERGVQCNLTAAQNLADPLWKNMSNAEKQYFNDMAKEHNKKNGGSKKYNSLGVSFETVDSMEREKIEFLNIMSSNISSCIKKLHRRDKLKSHPFFVSHVNYFYITDDKYFVPAEMAIAVFSFEKGLIDSLHFFIALGEIPLGQQYKIKDRSDYVHHIPFTSSWTEGLSDYFEMYQKVFRFIQKYSPDDQPPIYTMCDELNKNYSDSAVRCALETMCDAARVDPTVFRVYHLDILFYEIIQILRPKDFFSTALMRSELEKDTFSYAQNLGCYFHDEIDSTINCSLSIVVRWIFTMCDHCCKYLNVNLILGYHVPVEVDVNWKKTTIKSADDMVTAAMGNLSFINEAEKDLWKEKGNKLNPCVTPGDTVRFPKSLMSTKIGARFDADPVSSVAALTVPGNDSDWPIGETGSVHGLGRGKAIPVPNKVNHTMLPTSGRGRLLSMKK